jgi:endoglucanase
MDKLASAPGVIWLTGPSGTDTLASRDIDTVVRTSTEAAQTDSLPVYMLYALPKRDACATYSSGGFKSSGEYLTWVDRILSQLKNKAAFIIEADGVAHTAGPNSCMSATDKTARYELLSQIAARLKQSPLVAAAYLDAGHSEWFPDPAVLVEPLKRSGLDKLDGISANVSYFVATGEITAWAQNLITAAGPGKGAVIDTSRNGRGSMPAHVTGEARWCNPSGRGTGPRPTTQVSDKFIDAYLWIKVVGESDGACNGYPVAGTFMSSVALQLARDGIE